MPNPNKNKYINYDLYTYDDAEFYGLLRHKNGRYKIDTKRMKCGSLFRLDDKMLNVMENRSTKYFFPKHQHKHDYAINVFRDKLNILISDWNTEYKPMISKIKSPDDVEDSTRMHYISTGVYEYDEVGFKGLMAGLRRKRKYVDIIAGFYSQYILQMTSIVEATTIQVLSERGVYVDKFNRDTLYRWYMNCTDYDIRKLDSFKAYDKIYSLWNFLKHNSLSTYETMVKVCPEMLGDAEFSPSNGILAIKYVEFEEDMITKLLSNLIAFFEDICEKCFNEEPEESKWNYDNYFLQILQDDIDMWNNPI
ncbi:hypothetical protein RJG79_10595 [Mycoplasmatota bacterium WC44]